MSVVSTDVREAVLSLIAPADHSDHVLSWLPKIDQQDRFACSCGAVFKFLYGEIESQVAGLRAAKGLGTPGYRCPAWKDGQHCYGPVRLIADAAGYVEVPAIYRNKKMCKCGATVEAT